jgi:hypothetical protein
MTDTQLPDFSLKIEICDRTHDPMASRKLCYGTPQHRMVSNGGQETMLA